MIHEIDGIQIIETLPLTYVPNIFLFVAVVTILTFVLSCCIGILILWNERKEACPLILMVSSVIAFVTIFSSILGYNDLYGDANLQTYKITMSDDVSAKEFYEYYEILNKDGEVYTIREKYKG